MLYSAMVNLASIDSGQFEALHINNFDKLYSPERINIIAIFIGNMI